jgi:hypothetical protein
MQLYYIEHVPTQRLYTPNSGTFRAGRNWRKNNAVMFTKEDEAINEAISLVENHRSGAEPLRIRTYGGFDCARPEDAVGDGYIRERDFRVVEFKGSF